MPILIFILLVILVAQIGFWDALGSVLGAIGVIILTLLVLAALVVCIVLYAIGRLRSRT
jgi:hypothetical protein